MGLPWWFSVLRLCASTAGSTGSIPEQGTKIPHDAQGGQIVGNETKKEQTAHWTQGQRGCGGVSALPSTSLCSSGQV